MTNKPREFWVYEGKRNCTSLRFVYTNPKTIKQNSPENWDEFYVIEAAPLLEKIERLEHVINHLYSAFSKGYVLRPQGPSHELIKSILEGK